VVLPTGELKRVFHCPRRAEKREFENTERYAKEPTVKRSSHLKFVLTATPLALALVADATAQTYSVLHSFGVLTNVTGGNPVAGLVRAPDGTLYGTASGAFFLDHVPGRTAGCFREARPLFAVLGDGGQSAQNSIRGV